MKKLALVALAMLTVFAVAATAADQLVQFKTGEISFDLRQSDGVSPLADASIQMLSSEDSSVLAETVSDEMGQAVLDLEAGRYLLNVSGSTLAVMDVTDGASLSACRIIVPDAGMLVAGAEEAASEDDDKDGGAAWILPAAGIAAGVAVLVAAGFIIDHNAEHGHGKPQPAIAAPVVPPTKPSPKKKETGGSPSAQ